MSKDKWLDVAELIDALRVVPRLLVFSYIIMLHQSTLWFMSLEDPNNAQAGFIATLWGAAAAIFKFYAETGRSWENYKLSSQNRSESVDPERPIPWRDEQKKKPNDR